MNERNQKIAPESYVLAGVCLLDLLTTLFWVSYRDAAEGNPIMAFYLHHGGTPAFIAAKVVLCAPPLFIAEWARRMRPRFVRSMLRLGIIAYLALYGAGVAQLNQEPPASPAAPPAPAAVTATAPPMAVSLMAR